MKSFLLAASAAALCALPATAVIPAVAQEHETRLHVAQGSRIVTDGGVVVEIRGEDGERTVHITRDGGESEIRVDGRDVRVADGAVYIDGERHEAGSGSMVVIDGDEVEIVEGGMGRNVWVARGGEAYAFGDHEAAMAEAMERVRMHVVELDGMDGEIEAAMREAIEELENHRAWNDERWDDLSEEEREEVRAARAEAHAELRAVMEELRGEMREIEIHRAMGDEARREVRVEIQRAARDAARAERDVARAERDVERAARDHARHMRWVMRHAERGERVNEEVRVEEDEDGRRRVWVDGEEQTGEDLVEWLNRLEGERFMQDDIELAGGDRERRVFAYRFGDAEDVDVDVRVRPHFVFRDEDGEMHFGEGEDMDWVFTEDGENRIVIELDGEVIDLEEFEGEHVIESEGGRRVIIRRRSENDD